MNARRPKGPRRKWDVAEQHLYNPRHETTAAQNKVWDYLIGVVETPAVRMKVRELRMRFKIPLDGAKKRPDNLDTTAFLILVDKLRRELALDIPWILTLTDYVLHGDLSWHSSFGGLIEVSDEDGMRPAVLRISPYATQNDIIDYVKKVYKTEIEPIQKKHKSRDILIGKIRRRNPEHAKIRQFIYKHRKFSAKKTAELVADKFGKHMVYTYVSKILREERAKRRK